MGYELIGKNHTELHINAGTSNLFDGLTAGWWSLIGLPSKLTPEDCKHIARVLKNYANIQKIMDDDCRKIMHWDKEDTDSINWLLYEAVPFFRECGGCRRNDG